MSKVFKPEELQKMVTIQYDRLLYSNTTYWIGVYIDDNPYYFTLNLIEHDKEAKQITAPFWLIRNKELEAYIVE